MKKTKKQIYHIEIYEDDLKNLIWIMEQSLNEINVIQDWFKKDMQKWIDKLK